MRYSAEQLGYLEDGYKKMSIAELTPMFNKRFGFNKTPVQIKATLSNYKFVCGRKLGQLLRQSKILTSGQIEYLVNNYTGMTRKEMTVALNEKFSLSLTVNQIISFTKNHGIKSGRTGQFEQGTKPWNTGTKGIMKPNSGSFQKGDIPSNRNPLGHERVCSKDGYILIKVEEKNPYTSATTRYRHKQQVVWEKNYGPIPKGKVVWFKNGDKLNCDPENLMLISRAEALRLNQLGYSKLPEELKPTLVAVAKLETKAFALKNNERPA